MNSVATILSPAPRARARTLASDAFGRTAATGAGIGSADRGGAWTLSATGLISINGSQLVAALTAGTNRHATLATAQINSDTYLEFQATVVPSSGSLTFACLARSVSSTQQLRGKITVGADLAIKAQGFTIHPSHDAGAETSIAASTTVTRLGNFTVDTKYRMRMQVRGSNVRLKIWLKTQSEPVAWDWSSTQTKLTAVGDNGWRILAPSGNASTISLDDFLVRSTTGYVNLEAPAAAASGTLQSILDDTTLYPNGSTVILPSTTYYETLTVPASRNLTLRALVDGETKISGAQASTIDAGWASEGSGTWSVAVVHQVYGVMVAGRPLLRFDTLAHLKDAFFPDGVTVAPPEGFYSTAGTLYVKLEGGGDPTGTPITITRSGVTSTAGGTGLTISSTYPSTSSITLEGITFELWPRRAIFVDESETIVARRCWFHNCYYGVQDSDATGVPTSHIRLEYCTFNLRGTAGTYNGPWAIRKALGKDSQGSAAGDNGLYGSNLGGKLCKVTCDDIQVYRCVVHDTFDCTEIKGRYTASDYGLANRTSYIRECLFWRFCDNGPEVEPGNRYTYMEVDHNIFVDGFVPLGMAPFMAGQIDLHHNVIYISADWYADGVTAGSNRTIGKVLKHTGTGAFPSGTQVNVHTYNNTFLMGRSSTQWGQLYETGDETDFAFTGCYYRDNITLVYKSQKWELNGYVLSQYNLIWHGGSATQFTAADFLHASAGGTANIFGGDSRDQRPTTAVLSADPLLGATSTTLFNLTASSPARNQASDGGDLGAVPYGSSWSMPVVGCQWAACTATLPSVPASIDASLMGI